MKSATSLLVPGQRFGSHSALAGVYDGMLQSSSSTLFSDPEIDTKAARTYVNACLWFTIAMGIVLSFADMNHSIAWPSVILDFWLPFA